MATNEGSCAAAPVAGKAISYLSFVIARIFCVKLRAWNGGAPYTSWYSMHLIGWLVGCWLVGWLVGWLVNWLAGYFVGWLLRWLVTSLVGETPARTLAH